MPAPLSPMAASIALGLHGILCAHTEKRFCSCHKNKSRCMLPKKRMCRSGGRRQARTVLFRLRKSPCLASGRCWLFLPSAFLCPHSILHCQHQPSNYCKLFWCAPQWRGRVGDYCLSGGYCWDAPDHWAPGGHDRTQSPLGYRISAIPPEVIGNVVY